MTDCSMSGDRGTPPMAVDARPVDIASVCCDFSSLVIATTAAIASSKLLKSPTCARSYHDEKRSSAEPSSVCVRGSSLNNARTRNTASSTSSTGVLRHNNATSELEKLKTCTSCLADKDSNDRDTMRIKWGWRW